MATYIVAPIYCRRRQYTPVLAAPIVALKHIISLSPATIYAEFHTFFQANWATIYAFIFDSSCPRQQNMPLAFKQVVAENADDLEIKY